ncbi:gluconolactonase [Catalinimonas alkaloidigena]|uniref:Gluconolactonase n=1 Tax=Catalinimonas alkaloidigena TaxID=1075417 RepID=A0A1G9AQ28_9BACT|nr:SMP-30/gluconolactonase/LRE family protein [Catalinimonas alkaloidigena]SDK29353.1 gluconolactonase [Catalinimonas alkaloidigena]
MTRLLLTLPLFWLIHTAVAQVPPDSSGTILVKDPALRQLLDPQAKVEKVAGGFQFTEGPLWSFQGSLLFSDIPANRVYEMDPVDGEVYELVRPSGNSNGLTYDREEQLLLCQHGDRRVVLLRKDGALSILADTYRGKRFNSPNDLTVHSSGTVFFTDPPWGLPQNDDDPAKELPYNGVYRYYYSELSLIDSTLHRPNGIALSPDEKYLYVSETKPDKQINWLRYELDPSAKVLRKEVFISLPPQPETGNADGMKVDVQGNLYATGPGGLWIFSPEGKHLGTIKLPELPSNCAWGGTDGRTLYMTARTGIFRVKCKVKGIQP